MKTIKTTILILIAFIVGAFASNIYASSVRMVMVPEYIGNYSTVELLNYVSNMKTKDDASKQIVAPKASQPSQMNQPIQSVTPKIETPPLRNTVPSTSERVRQASA